MIHDIRGDSGDVVVGSSSGVLKCLLGTRDRLSETPCVVHFHTIRNPMCLDLSLE